MSHYRYRAHMGPNGWTQPAHRPEEIPDLNPLEFCIHAIGISFVLYQFTYMALFTWAVILGNGA